MKKFELFLQKNKKLPFFKGYYNLDSKLDSPEAIGNANELLDYLNGLIKSKDKELFVIVTKEVDSLGNWRTLPNTNIATNNTSSYN